MNIRRHSHDRRVGIPDLKVLRNDEFTHLERFVIDMLLAGELPALRALRQQFAASRPVSRELTGVGFFTYFDVPASTPRVAVPGRLAFGDVEASIDGLEHGAGFVLFIQDGALEMLEGYTYDEPWPVDVTSFSLRYISAPRNLSAFLE